MLKASFLSLMFFAASLTLGQAPSESSTLIIDDFKTGSIDNLTAVSSGLPTRIQTGSMLGGSRETVLHICGTDKCSPMENPFAQTGSVQVLTNKGALVVSAGYKVQPRLEVYYTKIPQQSANLSSKYDQFQIAFDGLDHEVDLTILLSSPDKKNDGHISSVCKVPPSDRPFVLSFPFSRFTVPEHLKGTSTIGLIFQTTGAGGLDFALTSIRVAKGSPSGVAVVTCAH